MADFSTVVQAIEAGNKTFETISKDYGARLRELEDKAARSTRKIYGSGPREPTDDDAPDTAAYRKAFGLYVKRGDDRELKALAESTNSGADGGYAVPKVIDQQIEALAVAISPIRQIANVVQISTSALHKLVDLRGTASGWVAETAARPATNTPTLTDIVIPANELYANPQATQVMLDDVFFDGEAWIAGELATEFGRAEGAAFVAGDGSNKPLGFLAGTPVATSDATRAFGVLQYIPTTIAADWLTQSATVSPADSIKKLVYALKAQYRANATFVMNSNTLGEIAQFKDQQGRYIYTDSLDSSVPSKLLGYDVLIAEDMPTKAANAFSVAFGDFKRGYTVVDRLPMRIIRDPFSAKPYIGYCSVKRVGGAIINSEAIKLLKFAVA